MVLCKDDIGRYAPLLAQKAVAQNLLAHFPESQLHLEIMRCHASRKATDWSRKLKFALDSSLKQDMWLRGSYESAGQVSLTPCAKARPRPYRQI